MTKLLIGTLISSLLWIIAGIFPGNFVNKQTLTMLLHPVGTWGSYLFFLLGAFTYPRQLRKTVYWVATIKPTLLFTWLTIIFGFWPSVFPAYPAAEQRINLFFYLLWFGFMAYKLYQRPSRELI